MKCYTEAQVRKLATEELGSLEPCKACRPVLVAEVERRAYELGDRLAAVWCEEQGL